MQYPVLETDRLLLRPLKEEDFEIMYRIETDKQIQEKLEQPFTMSREAYREEFVKLVHSDNIFSVLFKETKRQIGYLSVKVHEGKKAIRFSQSWGAILPEYWNQGLGTEAMTKLLHFAFVGIKTPWICANQFHSNPAAGRMLQKCGMTVFRTFRQDGRPYDQYRYVKKDYFADHPEAKNDSYQYHYEFLTSPYSFEHPIRKIDGITYIQQPTGYLCGQSVIAMLAGRSVDEVIAVMKNDKGTSVTEIRNALTYYGFQTATKARVKCSNDTVLPDCAVLSIQLPGYGHWGLYYKGKYYDPEFGVLDRPAPKESIYSYWEVLIV